MTRRTVRNSLIALGGLIVLVVAAGAIAISRFDPNSLKPRVIEAVQQATGRKLALNGPISLQPSLWPTVELRDVTFANPPGFSRPDMATLQRLDVQLALWPLLSHQVRIERLVLVKPDIRLETNTRGEPNWVFARQAAPQQPEAATPAPRSAAPASGGASQISVDHLRIDDGTLSYRDDVTGRTTVLALTRFEANANSSQAPLKISVQGRYNGAGFEVAATLGPIDRLLASGTDTPWPIQATLQSGNAKFSIDGSMRQPLQGRGYDVALIANVPDAAALAPFVPPLHLPPVRDLRITAKITDQGGTLPRVSALALHAGASDLSSVEPGLRLETADVTAPDMKQPMQVHVQAVVAQVPVTLTGTLGPPASLLGTENAAPYPVDLTGSAGDANLKIAGSIARPAVLQGVDLRISAQAADLARLAPLAKTSLPPLKSVAFEARLTDTGNGLAKGVALHAMKLTTPDADVAGDLSVGLGSPPAVTAKLRAARIDADALLAAFRPAGTPRQPGGDAATGAPAKPTQVERSKPAGSGRLFPDTPLPFGLLRLVNADIALTAQQVKSGSVVYRNINTHLELQNGKLRLDPFVADLPEGHVTLALTADGTAAAPPVSVNLHAPALALAPLLAALHEPPYATGNLEVRADLRGAGDSPHAIAADLDGTVGVALENGTVDTKLLEKLLGPALAKANLLDVVTHGGTSQVRCFAFRMDAQRGIGEVRTLVLSSSLLSFDGGGSVNLGSETLALSLRPQGRVGGTGVVVPLRVTGALRDPAVSVDATGAVGNLGAMAGAAAAGKSNSPLGAIAGALIGGQVATGESCAGPLALARGQAAPAAAQPSASPTPAARPQPPKPADLLRQLFR